MAAPSASTALLTKYLGTCLGTVSSVGTLTGASSVPALVAGALALGGPASAVLALGGALGLTTAHFIKSHRAENEAFREAVSLEDVLRAIHDQARSTARVEQMVLTDRANRHAAAAATAVREGLEPPQPGDDLAPYLMFFRLAARHREAPESLAPALEELRQTVLEQEEFLLRQQPAEGVTTATLEAAYDLLTQQLGEIRESVAGVSGQVTAADQGSRQRDERWFGYVAWLRNNFSLLMGLAIGGLIVAWITWMRVQGTHELLLAQQDEQRRDREVLVEMNDRLSRPGQGATPQNEAEKREGVLAAMAAKAGLSLPQFKRRLERIISDVLANPAADAHTKALAEFAAQQYATASQTAQEAAGQAAKRQQEMEALLEEDLTRLWLVKDERRDSLTLAGDSEMARDQPAVAVPLYAEALGLADVQVEWLKWSTQARRLAAAHIAAKDYPRAAEVLLQVVQLHTRHSSALDPLTVAIEDWLISQWENGGKFMLAADQYKARWEAQSRAIGPNDPATLASLDNYAVALTNAGFAEKAEPLQRHAWGASECLFGPDHPDTLRFLNNLATLLHAKGDLAEAEPLLRRALEARVRTLDSEHPDSLSSLNNLAAQLQAKGDLIGAEPLYRRALEARERTLGPEHPDTLNSLNNLAGLLTAQDKWPEALALAERAEAGFLKRLGAQHPDTQNAAKRVAEIKAMMGV